MYIGARKFTKMNASQAYQTAWKANKRLPKLEVFILENAKASYDYAVYIIKDRWVEAEPIIAKDGESASLYARNVIKGRWAEGEPIILRSSKWSYNYAYNVIKDRWEEAEQIIATNAYFAYLYAKDVIKWRIKGNKDFYISVIPKLWFIFPKRVKNSPDIRTAYFKEMVTQ